MSIFFKKFGPYSKLRTANWPIVWLKQTQPYNNYFYCLKSWKKNVLSLKNGLTTTSYNVISRNHTKLTITERDSNCGKGWTNSYWKHHVLMLYPLGKKLRKTFGRVASTISVTHGHSLYAFIPFVFLFMVFSILELWCLDSMLVVHLPSLHSAFRNYVASISWF